MSTVFLKAEWRKLILANYPVDPASLRTFIPFRTELDIWEGEAYVSLVGFQFRNVLVRGLSIPFHTHFPEVNLRFYVRHKQDGQWKRGVVFIREIVPLPAVTLIANTLFRERYLTLPMRSAESEAGQVLQVGYQWKYKDRWNRLTVEARSIASPLKTDSHEEFITEHFWGYTWAGGNRTGEYQVAHPRWDVYPVLGYQVDCDFGKLYGSAFAGLEGQEPQSVFLAEGSPIQVYSKANV
jgi:uncharacterized protein YqjF (DUF2071 family)